MKEFKIGKTKIGRDNPCFVVAEIGINFNGSYDNAIKLIDQAKKAGCNAVKFQLFLAEKMYVPSAGEDKSGDGRKKDIFKIVKAAELEKTWIPKLKRYANKNNLEFLCTVCDENGADFLAKQNIDAFKIASYEITHIPLLRHVAKKQKPIVFSCGAANIKDIADALEVFAEEKNYKIALLHCVANYGADVGSLNLGAINILKSAFPDLLIGYSDHSSDPVQAPVAAVALGAKIIEKHITLDKNMPGPDHFFALNPQELSLMVKKIREAEDKIKKGVKIEVPEKLLGVSKRETFKEEQIPRDFAYRCVFATNSIKKGEVFTQKNIAVLRPGNKKRGLEPKYYEILLGKKATKNIKKHKSIDWNDALSS